MVNKHYIDKEVNDSFNPFADTNHSLYNEDECINDEDIKEWYECEKYYNNLNKKQRDIDTFLK